MAYHPSSDVVYFAWAGARELAPAMPIVYMSGDSTHEWASQGVPGSVMLAKPFAPAQLVTAVATLVTEADMHPPPPPAG